jgi:hypothetical protein
LVWHSRQSLKNVAENEAVDNLAAASAAPRNHQPGANPMRGLKSIAARAVASTACPTSGTITGMDTTNLAIGDFT